MHLLSRTLQPAQQAPLSACSRGAAALPACLHGQSAWHRHLHIHQWVVVNPFTSMDTACAARVHCCLAAAPRGFTQRRRSRRAPLVHAQQQSQGTDEQGAGNDSAPQQQPPTGPPAAASQPPPLTDPAGMVVYGGKLPPARRLVVSGLTATAIGESPTG